MSAAIHSDPEMTMKCSGHDVNIALTATTLHSTGPKRMGEAAYMTFLDEVRLRLFNKAASIS